MKSQKLILSSIVAVTIAVTGTLALQGDEVKEKKDKKEQLTTYKGEALCMKCELGKADKCQNAFRVEDDKGEKHVYLIADNDATKGFHKNVCSDVKHAWAVGKLDKDGETITLVPKKIGLLKEVELAGTLTCGKCGLGETKSCQNVIQVKNKKGKTLTYFLDPNKVSKDFHRQVCQGSTEGTVKGLTAKIQGKHELVAAKIAAK